MPCHVKTGEGAVAFFVRMPSACVLFGCLQKQQMLVAGLFAIAAALLFLATDGFISEKGTFRRCKAALYCSFFAIREQAPGVPKSKPAEKIQTDQVDVTGLSTTNVEVSPLIMLASSALRRTLKLLVEMVAPAMASTLSRSCCCRYWFTRSLLYLAG